MANNKVMTETHTALFLEKKDGMVDTYETKLTPLELRALITGTSRNERFISFDNLDGGVDIVNLDRVESVRIEVHAPESNDEDDD